jgi:hypothetical protein
MIASGWVAWVDWSFVLKRFPSRDRQGAFYVARRGYNRAPMKTSRAVVKRMTT